jgi:4-amino-4-deoxy-L-arabinose transferase-like glycosyltransferase
MPLALLSIVCGAALALLTAYALGVALLRKLPAPPEIALALGAAAESFLVFLLLLANLGYWYVFLAMGLVAGASWFFLRAKRDTTPRPPAPGPRPLLLNRTVRMAAAVIFCAYGVWYLVNALAPETLPDGMTYHLGLPYEYVRLGGFPNRITFYDMVPQGMEMLYTVAFAVGRHSAAKLVEFAFFLATLPLIFRIGRRLGMSDLASLVAAVFYFCAPVASVTGASSYNDGAGVFFALAAFYLLLIWRDSTDARYLVPAGVLAGFCYAIKLPGAMVLLAAVLFVWWASRAAPSRAIKNTALLAAGAVLAMAPWLVRNAILTGNPLAPLFNSFFPNPYFHVATERELALTLGSFGSVRFWAVPWELAFGDRLVGTFGPLLLALPLGLVALRRPAGRWCWVAAALLAIPWFSNTGARFLMPAVSVAGFTLAMVLPKPAAWTAVALQAILCWPQVIGFAEPRYAFRLADFPLAAALRIEPENDYLWRKADEFKLAQMIEKNTPPDAKILGLATVANAYLARDVRVNWQSAEADALTDSLRLASVNPEPMYDWQSTWPAGSFARLRFRLAKANNSECDIDDIRIYSGDDLVYSSPNWTVRAWPNSWEAPLALDGNLATRWRTWEAVRAGMYFEIRFDHPQRISRVVLFSYTPGLHISPDVYGLTTDGKWLNLGPLLATRLPKQDLRVEAVRALRRAGYRYLLVPTGGGGAAPVGNAITARPAEWGLAQEASAGQYYLFRIK